MKQVVDWIPDLVWMRRRGEKFLAPTVSWELGFLSCPASMALYRDTKCIREKRAKCVFKQQNNLQYRIRTVCTAVYETYTWKNQHSLLCQLGLLGINTAKNNNSSIHLLKDSYILLEKSLRSVLGRREIFLYALIKQVGVVAGRDKRPFVTAVCLSVCQHVSSRLRLDVCP